MELIAVILKGKTSPERFADAQTLLNYGFASYALKTVIPDEPLPPVPVTLGTQATVQPVLGEENQLLLEKAKTGELSQSVTLESSVQAPVAVGDRLGTLTVWMTHPIGSRSGMARPPRWRSPTRPSPAF